MNPPERRSAPAPQLSPAADRIRDSTPDVTRRATPEKAPGKAPDKAIDTAPFVPRAAGDDTPGEAPGRPVESAGVRLLPGRRRRQPSRAQLLVGVPLLVLGAFLLTAVPLAALSYVVAGPRITGTAFDHAGRLEAAVVGGVFAVLAAVLGRLLFVHRLAAPFVAVDTDGVWLGRGGRRNQGLLWSEIAAVDLVPEEPPRIPEQQRSRGRRTPKQVPVVRAGLARKPFLDLYPVEKISEEPGTPLGSRVVTAQPTAPGLRGRRYVLELAAPAQDIAALGRALDRHAPAKRITPS